jgi:hypothetical protein
MKNWRVIFLIMVTLFSISGDGGCTIAAKTRVAIAAAEAR